MNDVLVIGGGAAGLSAAMMLGRVRRSVTVIDSGEPRNAPAEGVHGLLALDGTPPGEILARGREQARGYGAAFAEGVVVDVARDGDGFTATLADGTRLRARRVLVATGLVDVLPDVPGLRERWGREVLHCPYCHGWEARDRAIGVLATGPMSVHQALLFRGLTGDLVYFAHTTRPTPEEAARLAAWDIPVVEGEVAEAVTGGGRLTGVRLGDGTLVAREAIAVATRLEPRVGFLAGLGLVPVAHPSGMGEHLPADPAGRTSVPGVWVAGNATDLAAQVGAAAAAGALAGAQINADLVAEDTARRLTA
ncbi:oxidoreductase [Actinorhabdospora filicis]|uniref:Oxidoreductase n=2 Tax=Actinorhabdospora filicis TaxID=1785913 RepID=A0A9W6SH85_9ACTN|nr:NAD(P)/FAD-dependent oxidoreductase [Actinorhabdospora filicis]GLZ75406.1 oxidoreductase [Actinorhabdospora filicis]